MINVITFYLISIQNNFKPWMIKTKKSMCKVFMRFGKSEKTDSIDMIAIQFNDSIDIKIKKKSKKIADSMIDYKM